MTQQQIIYLVLTPIIIWRLYSRVQRLIKRQEAKPRRLWSSAILFPVIVLLLGWACMSDQMAVASLAGGALCGVMLAFLGLRLTVFDETDGKLFYKPNLYIGMGLTTVFVMRMVYRFSTMPAMQPASQGSGDPALRALASSHLTLFIFGVLFCYYPAYSAGILRRRARVAHDVNAVPAESNSL